MVSTVAPQGAKVDCIGSPWSSAYQYPRTSRIPADASNHTRLSRLRTPTQFPADFIYILNSTADPDQYYTGITENVRVRLAEHNRGGCRHTRRWTPWRVIVVVAFASEKPALDFERYLKTGSGCAFATRHFR